MFISTVSFQQQFSYMQSMGILVENIFICLSLILILFKIKKFESFNNLKTYYLLLESFLNKTWISPRSVNYLKTKAIFFSTEMKIAPIQQKNDWR
jgi:hypothetical protein